MVYIQSWQEFQDAAESLYSKSPNNVRVTLKIRGGWTDCLGTDALLRQMEIIRGQTGAEDYG